MIDFAREFEKAPKNLMKAKPNELLFADDYSEGRMQIVCAAMNEERKALDEMVGKVLAEPEGEKHLVRALNNLKTIAHHGARIFAQAIFETLEKRYSETADNYEYQKSAFIYELGNHEYHINSYLGDWDTLSAFGNIEWHGQGPEARQKYYAELKFTETQIRAFEDARKEFLRMANENDWY